jgi:hypothetical protein
MLIISPPGDELDVAPFFWIKIHAANRLKNLIDSIITLSSFFTKKLPMKRRVQWILSSFSKIKIGRCWKEDSGFP